MLHISNILRADNIDELKEIELLVYLDLQVTAALTGPGTDVAQIIHEEDPMQQVSTRPTRQKLINSSIRRKHKSTNQNAVVKSCPSTGPEDHQVHNELNNPPDSGAKLHIKDVTPHPSSICQSRCPEPGRMARRSRPVVEWIDCCHH